MSRVYQIECFSCHSIVYVLGVNDHQIKHLNSIVTKSGRNNVCNPIQYIGDNDLSVPYWKGAVVFEDRIRDYLNTIPVRNAMFVTDRDVDLSIFTPYEDNASICVVENLENDIMEISFNREAIGENIVLLMLRCGGRDYAEG